MIEKYKYRKLCAYLCQIGTIYILTTLVVVGLQKIYLGNKLLESPCREIITAC